MRPIISTLILWVGLLYAPTFAQKIAINSGAWNDPNIWSPVGVPTINQDVTISTFNSVSLPINFSPFAHDGNVTVEHNATLNLSGSGMNFKGLRFTNNGTLLGNLNFVKNGLQYWEGYANNNSTPYVTINKPAGNVVIPTAPVVFDYYHSQICSFLDLVSGKLKIGDHCLLQVLNDVLNENANKYVVLEGETARLSMYLSANQTTVFPIGSPGSFSPAIFNVYSGNANVYMGISTTFIEGKHAPGERVNRRWIVEPVSGWGATHDLTLTWNDEDQDPSFNETSCAIAKLVCTNLTVPIQGYWFALAANANAALPNGTLRSLTKTGEILEFNEYTALSGGALPVELVSFKGQERGLNNTFQWTTLSETNSAWHVIQRFDEKGDRWIDLGKVRGHGTTKDAHNYSFEDKKPIALGYYRLKFEDSDGTIEYSKTIVVKRKSEVSGSIAPYPNPFVSELRVDYKVPKNVDNTELSIINQFGKVIEIKQLKPNEEVTSFDLAELPSGVYYLRMISDGQVMNVERVIKQ